VGKTVIVGYRCRKILIGCRRSTTEVAVKFRRPETLTRTPLLITTNNPIWRFCTGDEEALRNRMFIFYFNHVYRNTDNIPSTDCICFCTHCKNYRERLEYNQSTRSSSNSTSDSTSINTNIDDSYTSRSAVESSNIVHQLSDVTSVILPDISAGRSSRDCDTERSSGSDRSSVERTDNTGLTISSSTANTAATVWSITIMRSPVWRAC
jgi:hypothetical protein